MKIFDYSKGTLRIVQIPVLNDNYIYLLHNPKTNETLCVDPAVSQPVIEVLEERNWTLSSILNTHHHWDHTNGIPDLIDKYHCKLFSPINESQSLPGSKTLLQGGDKVEILSRKVKVLAVPGHTLGHIAYYFSEDEILFVGDTVFRIGCGRLFEGTPQQMWDSLSLIKTLPDSTLLCCAHEYSLANVEFALSLDPTNKIWKNLRAEFIDRSRSQLPTVPMNLGDEKKQNPFMIANQPWLKDRLGLNRKSDVDCFAKIRSLKDNY